MVQVLALDGGVHGLDPESGTSSCLLWLMRAISPAKKPEQTDAKRSPTAATIARRL